MFSASLNDSIRVCRSFRLGSAVLSAADLVFVLLAYNYCYLSGWDFICQGGIGQVNWREVCAGFLLFFSV